MRTLAAAAVAARVTVGWQGGRRWIGPIYDRGAGPTCEQFDCKRERQGRADKPPSYSRAHSYYLLFDMSRHREVLLASPLASRPGQQDPLPMPWAHCIKLTSDQDQIFVRRSYENKKQ